MILLSALVVTAILIGGALQVTITTDIKAFFPQDDERVIIYNRIDEEFGGAETIMLAVEADHIFKPSTLERLDDLTQKLEATPGIGSVMSLTNASEMRLTDFGLETVPLMDGVPQTDAAAEAFGKKVLADDFYRGTVISDDATAALMVMQLDYDATRSEVVQAVQEVVDAFATGEEGLFLTGTPVLNEVLVTAMQSDLMRLIPLVLLILAVVLFAYFRSLRGVLLPFLTVGLSLIWTLGLMGYMGKNLSPLSAVMPVILISLGNGYAIYVITRHHEESRSQAAKEAAQRTLGILGIAVLMAGTTTVAGFLSNVGSSLTLMREFGLFTAFGVLSALVISLTVVPAILAILPRSKADRQDGKPKKIRFSPVNGLLKGLSRLSIERSRLVLGGTVVLVVLSIVGMTRLTSDSNFFNFFDPSSTARTAYELVKEKFGGSESVEIAVTGDLKDPELLLAMDRIAEDMAQDVALTRAVSAVDVVERIDAAIAGDGTGPGAIPGSTELIAQYYLLAEMDAGGLLSRFVNLDYTQGRIQARTSDTSPQGVAITTAAIQHSIEEHLPQYAEARITGMVVLLDALSEMLVKSQIISLLLSFVTVFIIVRLLIRSWEGSLLAVTVIGVVTVANFGLMGWLGIPLDIVTVLISSIGVGVGVDFSIHIYSRFQEEMRGNLLWEQALRTSVTSTGRAVLTNVGGVIAGFALLTSSSFPPLRYFGILVTFSMAMAALGSLSLLPAAVALRRKNQTEKVMARCER